MPRRALATYRASGFMVDVVFAALAGLIALYWVVQLLRFHAIGRDFPEVASGQFSPPPAADAPTIAVVIAAKDEESGIEKCVRSVLAQDYPRLTLIVADDRSADRTPEILARLASEHEGRLRVVTIDELPAGWGGQNHALHRGVSGSESEWLCFTDADCQLDATDAVSVAMGEARERGAELLSILPRMETPTFWEKIYLPLTSLVLLVRLRIAEVNDPESDAGYANGAFILIRRDAYESLGGHERVRHFVNDDVRLAELAKREGVALRVVGNADLLRTRMYETVAGAFRGWSRNFWGTLKRPASIGAAFAMVVVLFVVPWAGLGVALALHGAGAIGLHPLGLWCAPVLISHVGMVRLYRAFSLSGFWSLFHPLGALFLAVILLRSLGRALRGRGATWEGAHYVQPGGG